MNKHLGVSGDLKRMVPVVQYPPAESHIIIFDIAKVGAKCLKEIVVVRQRADRILLISHHRDGISIALHSGLLTAARKIQVSHLIPVVDYEATFQVLLMSPLHLHVTLVLRLENLMFGMHSEPCIIKLSTKMRIKGLVC
jgi:hypothetical protein